ncbi:thermonuclease family protein [Rhodococcus sp. NPDC058481]|uniref:thermonuclease family protein n=1 Tax=unclassified Rhodococcus (in: high G+C Gram-positive bacteria) TaxID=192944 RepID=UPI00364B43A1
MAAPLVTLVVPAVAAADPAPTLPSGYVTEVVDGDTIRVLDAVRGEVTVRVLGIDTPETKKPGHTVGCWGPEATNFARASLQGQFVNLIGDPTQDVVDHYGRTLAYVVRPDGFNYSVEAGRAGAAKSYVFADHPVARYGEITAAEGQARTAGVGLWGAPCFGATDSVPLAPAPAPTPVAQAPTGVYFKNCRAAWDSGVAPLYRGDAGYRDALDGDSDGKACEVRPK